MKAPFPYFGGKSRVAHLVWDALGDVDLYVEPFAGSLAVPLARPAHHLTRRRVREIVNDKDGLIANFWRAVAADPEAVAHYADWPINETDLFARHMWLVRTVDDAFLDRLHADPDFHDPKVAGWWVWGISAWIGGGWCSGDGAWQVIDGVPVKQDLTNDRAPGVTKGLPSCTSVMGVHRQLSNGIAQYFNDLAARLRDVIVCCGDWGRVLTDGAMKGASTVGVFLDPPYLGEVRAKNLYAVDDHAVAHDVREWCIEHGDDPRLRIVLAGYVDEHDYLMPDNWRRHRYTGWNSYGTSASAARKDGNHLNRHKETLWISPHCLTSTPTLFDTTTPEE